MKFFKNLSEQNYINLIISKLRLNNFTDEQIKRYLYLIVCGLEIFKYYFDDYKNKISLIYELYYTIIDEHIIIKK